MADLCHGLRNPQYPSSRGWQGGASGASCESVESIAGGTGFKPADEGTTERA